MAIQRLNLAVLYVRNVGRSVDLYRTVLEFERIGQALSNFAALVGASNHGTTKSWYAKDPDGIEFDIARFGRDESDGIGISARA
jgi:hypothetical protein